MVQKNKGKGKGKSKVIDASLLIEGEVGLTTIFGIVEFPPASRYCKVIYPTSQDFKKAIDIAWKLRKIGKPVGAVDILNASICVNRNFLLATKDSDYENIKLVEPKFNFKLVK